MSQQLLACWQPSEPWDKNNRVNLFFPLVCNFVGYHDLGYPNQGLKLSSETTQNAAQPMAQILFGHEKLEYAPGPWTNAMVRPIRGLTSRGAISASLEGSLPRPPDVQAISASLEAPSIEPSADPRHGETPPRSSPPRQTEVAAQPPDGTGCIYSSTTLRRGAGVRRCRAASAGVGHHATQRT